MNKLHKEQASDKQSNLDNKKISQPEKTEIAEIVPAENIVSTSTESKVQDNKVVDNLYNTTTSRINGEDVVLKSIHFDFNMFALTEENLIVSAENSTKIKNSSAKNDSFKIKLEGNSDEWGTDEYNYALSLKRTIAVKNDLVNKGISADRIITISYGESNPICKEQTAECWAKNRRVDHYLVP
ncbi:MAG: OmpA family protein [Arcobacter sp.]|nr:OmpA family protein [Arcobacter sp.]